MKVVVVGAGGTIGSAVLKLLTVKHEVVPVSGSAAQHRADIIDKASIEALLSKIGQVDAIVCAAGGAVFKSLSALTDADLDKCLHDKLLV